MNKEFVTYKQALALKELGFDEPCYKYVYLGDTGINVDHYLEVDPSKAKNYNEDNLCISQPTYSAAFRWFREKYKLHSYIHSDYSWNISGGIWDLGGHKGSRYDWDSDTYPTYEEAEQACLNNLIEIVKDGKYV